MAEDADITGEVGPHGGADVRADVHVFGSSRGYGTVAHSRGVADDEAQELESLQFGAAATADEIARLESRSVVTGRALRSGRFAISRMMPAGVDDAGRPTVEVITLILDARSYEACAGALSDLVADASLWRSARARIAGGVAVPTRAPRPSPRDAKVLQLLDLWRAALRVGAVGVVPEQDSRVLLQLVGSLDPADRARCRWGVGLASPSAPVDICSVADGAPLIGAREVLRPARDGAWHCGSETEYAEFRASGEMKWLPSIADIEANGRTRVIVEARRDADPASNRARPAGETDRARRLLPFAVGSAILSTVVLAVAIVSLLERQAARTRDQAPGDATTDSLDSTKQGSTATRRGSGAIDPVFGELPGGEMGPPAPSQQDHAPSQQGHAPSQQDHAPSQDAMKPAEPAIPGDAPSRSAPSAPTAPDRANDDKAGSLERRGKAVDERDSTPADEGTAEPAARRDDSNAETAAPDRSTSRDDIDLTQPQSIGLLLERLRRAEAPTLVSPAAVDPAAIWRDCLDQWIALSVMAVRLDRSCKTATKASDGWKNRDRTAWENQRRGRSAPSDVGIHGEDQPAERVWRRAAQPRALSGMA